MGSIKAIANILVIDNDIELLELVEFYLSKSGFKAFTNTSTKNIESILDEENIDLIVIDHNLLELDVSELIRYLRDKGIEIPIIFISAKVDFSKIEDGFLAGGDDYIVKPFNIKELIFRVKAVLKRTKVYDSDRLIHRDILIDVNNRKAYVEGEEIFLTKLEFNLLSFFVKNKNRIIDREKLLLKVWNNEEVKQKQTVTVTINRLKKKIDPKNIKDYIIPRIKIGYKFA